MEKWQERLIPGQAGIKELGQAEEVAQRTRELLAT